MATNTTEKLESLLQCPICKAKLSQPQALQCLHFYCEPCIKAMTPKTEGDVTGYECPVCKSITPVDKLRRMHFVNDLLEVVDLAKKEQTTCDRCKTKVPTHRCVDCKQFFCPDCKNNHNSYAFLEHHKWVEITGNAQPVVDKLVYCLTHPGELAKINCKDCNELICLICNGTKHKNHSAESVEEALARVIPAVQEQSQGVKQKIEHNETLLVTLKTRSAELKKGYKDMEGEISRKYEEVMRKAGEDKKQSMQELLDIKDEQMHDIEASIRKVEMTLKSQHNMVALSDTTLSTAQGASLLQTIQSDVKGGLDSFLEDQSTVDPNSFEFGAQFEPVTPQDSYIGTVSRTTSTRSDSKFIARPLSELAHITPRLVKDIKLGYHCYRFSIIDDKLWCIEYSSSKIHIYGHDGSKIRTISYNNIGKCRAVTQVKTCIVVATSTGLYQTDVDGNQSNRLVGGDICDVTVVNDTLYALNNQAKVHILLFQKESNSFHVQQEFHVQNVNIYDLNSIIVTSGFVYVGEFCGHTFKQLSMDGTFKQTCGVKGTGSEMLQHPQVCGSDATGCILIADRNNHRFQTFNNGVWQVLQVTGLSCPVYAAFYKDSFYVTQDSPQTLKIFSYK